MKFVRYRFVGREQYGALEGNQVRPMEGSPGALEPVRGAAPLALSKVRLLPPVLPSKIVGVGLNYRDHALEMGMALPAEPLIFLKPPSALVGPDEKILIPPQSQQVEFEGELAFVIGRLARKVPADKAGEYILGYTGLIDVSARDLQRKDSQLTRPKGFDTFAPIGPAVVTDIDASDLLIQTRLNGELRQNSRTSQLIFKCEELVSYISNIMTLFPGDVVTTGTPSGVGPMHPGDVVELEIEQIGCLRESVAAAE